LQQRSRTRVDRLAELLLCVMFAAAELLESLRQSRDESPDEKPA
jgi:hypothetical protein